VQCLDEDVDSLVTEDVTSSRKLLGEFIDWLDPTWRGDATSFDNIGTRARRLHQKRKKEAKQRRKKAKRKITGSSTQRPKRTRSDRSKLESKLASTEEALGVQQKQTKELETKAAELEVQVAEKAAAEAEQRKKVNAVKRKLENGLRRNES
jgi:hypothetical protein